MAFMREKNSAVLISRRLGLIASRQNRKPVVTSGGIVRLVLSVEVWFADRSTLRDGIYGQTIWAGDMSRQQGNKIKVWK